MAESSYQPPAGFTTMAAAAGRLHVSMVTLRRTIREQGIKLYADPKNRRVRLVRLEDVVRLEHPVPLDEEGKTAA